MKWQHSESTERPLVVDESLSKKYVYIRKNIETEVRTSEQGEILFYVYDEALVKKEDYEAISAAITPLSEQVSTKADGSALGSVEAIGEKASKGYEKHEVFYADGSLYKATVRINAGNTLIENGNCEKTTITEIIREA